MTNLIEKYAKEFAAIKLLPAKGCTVKDHNEAGNAIAMIVNIKIKLAEAFAFRGISPDETGCDLEFIAQSYYADLVADFGGLEMSEVSRIFHNGVRKVYGDFYGINAGTLYDWTRAYMASQERKDVVRERIEQRNSLFLERQRKEIAAYHAQQADAARRFIAEREAQGLPIHGNGPLAGTLSKIRSEIKMEA